MEQKLPTLPKHLSSPPVYSGVRVTRSLVLCACFVVHCLSFVTFSFGHCVSVIIRFTDSDLLQTLLSGDGNKTKRHPNFEKYLV
jgi:hypothetical protein